MFCPSCLIVLLTKWLCSKGRLKTIHLKVKLLGDGGLPTICFESRIKKAENSLISRKLILKKQLISVSILDLKLLLVDMLLALVDVCSSEMGI